MNTRVSLQGQQPKDDIFLNDEELKIEGVKQLDSELEPLDDNVEPGDTEKMNGEDYQYMLELRDKEEVSDGEEINPDIFTLTKVNTGNDEELIEPMGDEDLEELDEVDEPVNQDSPAEELGLNINPQKESKETRGGSIKEMFDDEGIPEEEGLEELIDEPIENNPEDELVELEDAGETEWTKDEIIEFVNSQDFETILNIDDETEFNIEEALDYLKLYPENKIYVTVEDEAKFDENMDKFFNKKDVENEEIENEEETITVDTENMELPNEDGSGKNDNKDEIKMESFSIFNLKGKKNVPDGIYVGSLKEEKMYGNFSDVKITSTILMINESKFKIGKHNLKESKNKEVLDFRMSNTEDFYKFLKDNSDISIKLK